MDLSHHEHWVIAAHQHSSFRLDAYRDLARYSTQTVPLCWDAVVGFTMYFNPFGFDGYHIACVLRRYIHHWYLKPRDDYCSKASMPQIQ